MRGGPPQPDKDDDKEEAEPEGDKTPPRRPSRILYTRSGRRIKGRGSVVSDLYLPVEDTFYLLGLSFCLF